MKNKRNNLFLDHNKSDTFLINSILSNNITDFHSLLDNDANPNEKDVEHHQTALMYAVNRRNFFQFVPKLLVKGADANIKDDRGVTALMWLVSSNEWEDIEDRIDLLLRYGADINAVDNEQESVLDWAQKSFYQKNVDILIKRGAG